MNTETIFKCMRRWLAGVFVLTALAVGYETFIAPAVPVSVLFGVSIFYMVIIPFLAIAVFLWFTDIN